MNSPITVSTLNEQIKGLLETTFTTIYVEGEISNLTHHSSGHIYFSVKDKKSTISCVMFRGNAQYLKFRLEVGQKIVISGNLTVYAPRGNYQLLAQKIEPSGVGALALAYEQLKTKLQIKGYFDKSLKKELPKYPNEIYVITSNTGAAIEDMKKILSVRYPMAKMILLPTTVQGENAKFEIEKNIKKADDLAIKNSKQNISNLIIVGRGGGSIEDLWAFNEEIVADAIFSANTPIISAVGHESDFVISDFVADVRASTPSNAIEISTPNINDLRVYLDSISDDFTQNFKRIVYTQEQIVNHLYSSFEQHSLDKKFELVQSTIKQLKIQYKNSFEHILNVKTQNINILKNNYELNHPNKKDKKGFVQISHNNKVINISELDVEDIVSLQNSSFELECKILTKKRI
ncbi:MAG: exodeoxyribonuclease VII large subunit [Campylobacterota bacterium]|nr:exodeoxyribonuclease VII large subunit [Campylobacterota bacterium]